METEDVIKVILFASIVVGVFIVLFFVSKWTEKAEKKEQPKRVEITKEKPILEKKRPMRESYKSFLKRAWWFIVLFVIVWISRRGHELSFSPDILIAILGGFLMVGTWWWLVWRKDFRKFSVFKKVVEKHAIEEGYSRKLIPDLAKRFFKDFDKIPNREKLAERVKLFEDKLDKILEFETPDTALYLESELEWHKEAGKIQKKKEKELKSPDLDYLSLKISVYKGILGRI